ncbi:MAG: phosphoethanolamine transferase [Salibacteraceae bacterium]
MIPLLIGVLYFIVANPDQNFKGRLSSNDYSLESNLDHIFHYDSAFYFIKPGLKNRDNTIKIKFKTPVSLNLKQTIIPWGEIKDKNLKSEIEFNGEKVSNEDIKYGVENLFVQTVLPGDSLIITVNNLSDSEELEQTLVLEKITPYGKLSFVLVCFTLLFIIWFFSKYGSYYELALPLFLTFLLGLLEKNQEQVFTLSGLFYPIIILVIYVGLLIINKSIKANRITSVFIHLIGFITCLVPLIYLGYSSVFNDQLSQAQFVAFFQSHFMEGAEYVSIYMNWQAISVLIFLVLLVIISFKKENKKSPKPVVIGEILLVLLLCVWIAKSQFSSTNSFKELTQSFQYYNEQLEEFKKAKARFSTTWKGEVTKQEKNETYVILVGESLNKNHMSLYGYCRETTPYLDRLKQDEKLIVMKNAISCNVHTHPVIEMALTTANQYNGKRPWKSEQLIPILNKANFETTWISNQVKYGTWDNVVSVLAGACQNQYFLNSNIGKIVESSDYDEVVIKKLQDVLSQSTNNNRVIFVHLIGNHGNYSERYPPEFNRFLDEDNEIDKGVFGNLKGCQINSYDNSVLYNDYIVNKAITSLDSIATGPSVLMYLSDHSENIVNWLGHNSGAFDYSMTEIPFFFYMNDDYKNRYSDKVSAGYSNQEKAFTNDFLDQIILDLTNCKTNLYVDSLSILNSNYSFQEEDLSIISKKYLYASKDNKHYVERKNLIAILNDSGVTRVIPHRLNSKAIFYEAKSMGTQGFECDVVVSNNDEGVVELEIGHDPIGGMSGNTLEDILLWDPQNTMKKIWLDFKNLNESNADKVLARLNELEKKFDLKNRLIVESTSKSGVLKEFRNEGFHTSYYLPTEAFLNGSNNEKTDLARRIADQIKNQNMSAISFDYKLLPDVVNYLEPLISNEIVYHTWDTSKNWNEWNLLPALKQTEYYQNPRVKTILIRYNSEFYL